MSESPIRIKMKKREPNLERLRDKTRLMYTINYTSAASCFIFFLLCVFALDIQEVIPHVLLGFALLNTLNTLLFKVHKNLTLTFNLTAVMTLAGAIIITLYSGGISSPFVFVLALVVFAGYVTTRVYGRIYLYLNLLIISAIFFMSLQGDRMPANVVPFESRDLFAFLSIFLAIYLLGGVFGKSVLRAQHKLYKSKAEIEERIHEKEMLLKEVHHRVKNNLQTVSSLLRMQSREIEDQSTRNLIKSSQNRVISMAMVHEMLYMREDLSKIEYKSYVHELSEYLVKSIKGSESNIKLNISIPDIELGIDTAIPLGLLINEAVTNALKYGFKDQQEGEISIILEKEDPKDYVLKIGDNGVGYDDNYNYKTSKSLGLKLIHNLTRQLKGSIIRDLSKKGTNYIIRFQEIKQDPFHSIA